MIRQFSATITTDASGNATVYVGSNLTLERIFGRIVAIKYAPGTIATGATLTFTGETSGQPIMTKANAGTSDVWYYPHAPANKMADGSASSLTEVPLCLFDEQLKLVVASGGATKTGAITLYVDEPV